MLYKHTSLCLLTNFLSTLLCSLDITAEALVILELILSSMEMFVLMADPRY